MQAGAASALHLHATCADAAHDASLCLRILQSPADDLQATLWVCAGWQNHPAFTFTFHFVVPCEQTQAFEGMPGYAEVRAALRCCSADAVFSWEPACAPTCTAC